MPGFLFLIWIASLVLLALVIATLAHLIVLRIARERGERAAPNRRARLSKALLHYAARGGPQPVLAISNALECQVVTETALNAIPILRDAAKARLIGVLRDVGFDARLRRLSRRGSLRDRLLALEGLILFPEAETVAALIRAERSRNLRIWLAALRTRCKIGAGPDMLGLVRLVDRSGARRSPIMRMLITERAQTHLNETLAALRRELPSLTRALLVRALGETRQWQALEPLRLALSHSDGAVRAAAAEGLGALGFDAAAASLARATRDPDWRVRLKASEAIGKLGLQQCTEQVAVLLGDEVWWVRFRAAEALRRLNPGGAGASGRSEQVHAMRNASS